MEFIRTSVYGRDEPPPITIAEVIENECEPWPYMGGGQLENIDTKLRLIVKALGMMAELLSPREQLVLARKLSEDYNEYKGT